jgi:cell division transport system permease protein
VTLSLVPSARYPVTALAVAIAVMSLVATLTLAGVLLVGKAAEGWRSEVGAEFTVQVRPGGAGEDIEARLAAIADVARATSGVTSARVLSLDETKALLEPWLGEGRMIDDLPVPRLVALTIDPAAPPDVARLAAAIEATAPGATLDTHRQWQGEVVRLAGLLEWLGNAIIVVIVAASAVLVAATARAAIDATRDTIEVLYLAGADDGFIVRTVELRLLAVAVKAALAGFIAALFVLLVLAAADTAGFDGRIPSAIRSLAFADAGGALGMVVRLAIAPAALVAVAAVTAHLAIGRILRQLF